MIFGSVCSGIEAASCAWYPLGWEAAFVSEIEPFPCSVLKQHYPDVPNWGDMTKFKEWPDACICGKFSRNHAGVGGSSNDKGRLSTEPERGRIVSGQSTKGNVCEQCGGTRINVLVGGTPCQSFSVAGLRKGLADPRGNLMLTYLAIADQYRPEWVVWENVPGVLSSNGGRDFASFLRGLAELGYGFAYRILDAQYLGVAQRRRRVFVVGHIGDWQRAAAVLFERHSLQGHPAPRREAGKEATASLRTRAPASGGQGSDAEHCVANTITAHTGIKQPDFTNYLPWPAEIAPTLDTHYGDKMGLKNQHINAGAGLFVASTLTKQDEPPYIAQAIGWSEELTASIELAGTIQYGGQGGRHDGVAYPINTQIAMRHEAMGESTGMGIGEASDPAFTLQSAHSHAVAFDLAQITSKTNRTRVEEGLPASTLNAAGQMHTAINIYGGNKRPDRPEGGFYVKEEATSKTLDSVSGLNPTAAQGGTAVMSAMQVRRLTPRECERLQGFPDNYTLVQHRNKPAADGPRYKALGNSMAVPCMVWIGRRIAMVEQLKEDGCDD